MATSGEGVATVTDLTIGFRAGRRRIPVVHGVSFRIDAGETFALVGESGCGKSVTALALTRLLPEPPAEYGGRAVIGGRDTATLGRAGLRALRRTFVSYVFQDPAAALNPVYTVGFQLREALPDGTERPTEAAAACLRQVGIPDPVGCLKAYPHALSGGMQQRVVTAMALASRPRLIVADEPTTALDVTVQAQVLDLLDRLRREQGAAMLLITHNLGLVGELADRIGVMYAGRLVEVGPTLEVLRAPRHPYTAGLIGAVPRLHGEGREHLAGIPGRVPAPGTLPAGCAYADRCPRALPVCRTTVPALESREGRLTACHAPLA